MKHVLVCVTGQRSCDRLISYGKELILVHGAGGNFASGDLAENLEYLHRCAVEHEANLTIIRSDNVVATMVSLINKFDISRIVMGETRKAKVEDSTTSAFEELPHRDVQIIVVPEEEEDEDED